MWTIIITISRSIVNISVYLTMIFNYSNLFCKFSKMSIYIYILNSEYKKLYKTLANLVRLYVATYVNM